MKTFVFLLLLPALASASYIPVTPSVVLVASFTAVNTSTITFAPLSLSAYSALEIYLSSITTTGATFTMKMSTAASGTIWDPNNDFNQDQIQTLSGAVSAPGPNVTNNWQFIGSAAQGNTQSLDGRMTIEGPNNSGNHGIQATLGYNNNVGNSTGLVSIGQFRSPFPITGISFFYLGGANILTGVVEMYGVPK